MKYQKQYLNDYTKVFKFSVFKYKIDNEHNNIPSIFEFRTYMKSIKHIDWIDESNNDEKNSKSTTIIHNDKSNCNSTAIIPYKTNNDNTKTSVKIKKDKRCKVKNEDVKINLDFNKFPYGQRYKYGWTNESSNDLSLKFPIQGCKFGSFVKNYDSYNDHLKQGILINNGRYDAVLTPKWDLQDWYFYSRAKKRV